MTLTCFNCRFSEWNGKRLICSKDGRMSLSGEPWWCYDFTYEPGTDTPEKKPYA